MKSLFSALSLLIVQVVCAQNGRITDSERLFLRNNYETTSLLLKKSINSLTDAEWNRKPSNGGWSVAETMEHIILAMSAQLQGLEKSLVNDPGKQVDLSAKDGWLLSRITDRGVKVQTPLEPKGSEMSREEMLEAYEEYGKRFLEILNRTDTAFRHHYGRSPYGEVDAYQLMIFIPGHIQRHLSQIEETLNSFQS